MEKINISIVQMCAKIGDKHYNFKKVEEYIVKNIKTDVMVLPEVWSIGWDCTQFQGCAEEINSSETINFLSNLAKEYNVNIIGGSLITKDITGKFYNTCPVFNRAGELVAVYHKNHLYSYYGSEENKYLSVGKNPVLVNLDGIKYGLTICYDIRFPEIYRAYRKASADVLINCACWASTKPIPWEMMTKSRAIENQTFMVAVNQYGQFSNGEYSLGHSRIIDYNGNVISEILNGEGIIQADLDIDGMYKFRDKCTILEDIKENYEVI